MKTLNDIDTRSPTEEYLGKLGYFDIEGGGKLGLVGSNSNSNAMLITLFDGPKTRVISRPDRFIPLENAILETMIPSSEWADISAVEPGDLVITTSGP